MLDSIEDGWSHLSPRRSADPSQVPKRRLTRASRRFERAVLGVSMEREPYYNAHFADFLSWACVNSPECAVLVGDWVEAFNRAAFKSENLQTAIRHSLRQGTKFIRTLRSSACDGRYTSRLSLTVLRWTHLQELPEYDNLLAAVSAEYEGKGSFRDDVRHLVWEMRGEKLLELSEYSRQRALKILDQYVLHEVAGFIVLAEVMGYPVLVYPDQDMELLHQVYQGKFAGISHTMPTIGLREFSEIRFT